MLLEMRERAPMAIEFMKNGGNASLAIQWYKERERSLTMLRLSGAKSKYNMNGIWKRKMNVTKNKLTRTEQGHLAEMYNKGRSDDIATMPIQSQRVFRNLLDMGLIDYGNLYKDYYVLLPDGLDLALESLTKQDLIKAVKKLGNDIQYREYYLEIVRDFLGVREDKDIRKELTCGKCGETLNTEFMCPWSCEDEEDV